MAIQSRNGHVALVLTRQKVPVLDRAKYAPANGLRLGGYVLADAPPPGKPAIILLASGSEVTPAPGAQERLAAARLAVEAAAPHPWYRWVGDHGAVLGIERFGASAPYQRIYQELGLTVENVVRRAKELLRT